jgi:hypothetical protein
MEKLNIALPKYMIYVIYVIGIFTVLNYFRGCSTSKEDVRMRKAVTELSAEIDTLDANTYSKKELDLKLQIEGIRTSKRTLYDNNAIVRTTVRPDDRMNEYDQKIDKLKKELDAINE